MSREVLDSALAYFVEHTGESTHRHCSFYGGEPTLHLDLMRYAAAYLAEHMEGRKYTMGLTSNFLEVSRELLEFFRERDFALLVSLDGPQEKHDLYRVTPQGEGTWARVMDNLHRLMEFDRDYYRRKVSFALTMAPPYRLREVAAFFRDSGLILAEATNGVHIAGVETPDKYWQSEEDGRADEEAMAELRSEYLDRVKSGTVFDADYSGILREYFDRELLRVYRRTRQKECYDVVSCGGICLPGQRKIYVRWDGAFFPCERIPEYESLRIGNYKEGVDSEKVYALCNRFEEAIGVECKTCWAMTVCGVVCFRDTFDEKGPVPGKGSRRCKGVRQMRDQQLSAMCSVLAENPNALRHLETYGVG